MDFFFTLQGFSDWGILALRLALAAVFLAHGLPKRAMWNMKSLEQMPAKMLSLMRLLSIAEPLGAAALLMGFMTQFAALGLGVIMAGAIYMKARVWKTTFAPKDKMGWEFDLVILAALFSLYFTGAGAFGMDRLWFGL